MANDVLRVGLVGIASIRHDFVGQLFFENFSSSKMLALSHQLLSQ